METPDFFPHKQEKDSRFDKQTILHNISILTKSVRDEMRLIRHNGPVDIKSNDLRSFLKLNSKLFYSEKIRNLVAEVISNGWVCHGALLDATDHEEFLFEGKIIANKKLGIAFIEMLDHAVSVDQRFIEYLRKVYPDTYLDINQQEWEVIITMMEMYSDRFPVRIRYLNEEDFESVRHFFGEIPFPSDAMVNVEVDEYDGIFRKTTGFETNRWHVLFYSSLKDIETLSTMYSRYFTNKGFNIYVQTFIFDEDDDPEPDEIHDHEDNDSYIDDMIRRLQEKNNDESDESVEEIVFSFENLKHIEGFEDVLGGKTTGKFLVAEKGSIKIGIVIAEGEYGRSRSLLPPLDRTDVFMRAYGWGSTEPN